MKEATPCIELVENDKGLLVTAFGNYTPLTLKPKGLPYLEKQGPAGNIKGANAYVRGVPIEIPLKTTQYDISTGRETSKGYTMYEIAASQLYEIDKETYFKAVEHQLFDANLEKIVTMIYCKEIFNRTSKDS